MRQWAPRLCARPCSRARKRRWSSPSASTRCCLWMTVSTHAGNDPAPHALVLGPLSATPRDQPLARDRRRQAHQATLQALPDWLLAHRHRRGPQRGRQTLSHRGGGSDHQVCLCEASEKGHGGRGQDLPRPVGGGCPLPDPHCTDRLSTVSSLPTCLRTVMGATASWRGHPFDRACLGHGIEHRLTKPIILDQRSGREPPRSRISVALRPF